MAEERTRQTRARAELALVRLVHELGDDAPFLVVLGGLVPDVLTGGGEAVPEHQGTTDVDVLIISHVDPDANLGAVERALTKLEFKADANQDGWRWTGRVDGHAVRLEFLCDLPSEREGEIIRPAGCQTLAAANLRGTGYVAKDCEWHTLDGALADGTEVSVRVRFAGLEGYLLSKCVAVRTRAAAKDYYDLVYVLQHNRVGGPDEAAAALLNGNLAGELGALASTLREVGGRYAGPRDSGPSGYVEQALQVDPGADEALLRQDAVDVVQRFIVGLLP